MLAAVTVSQGVICREKDAGSFPGNERCISVPTLDTLSISVLPVQIYQVELLLVTWRPGVCSLARLMEM